MTTDARDRLFCGATVLEGDVLDRLRELPDESVQMVVTSPPYWSQRLYGCPPSIWDAAEGCEHEWGESLPGLRRTGRDWDPTAGGSRVSRIYGSDTLKGSFCSICGAWRGELGQEPTVDLFIRHTVQVFMEVFRVLRKDGCLFLNIGDTRQSQWPCERRNVVGSGSLENGKREARKPRGPKNKEKAMALIPERLLIALDEAGWTCRSKIVWEKPSAMPESARDRPTESWEPIYFLTKSPRYASYFDAIREDCAPSTLIRTAQDVDSQEGSTRATNTTGAMKAVGGVRLPDVYKGSLPGRKDGPGQERRSGKDRAYSFARNVDEPDRPGQAATQHREDRADVSYDTPTRNIRNVWRFSNPGTTFEHYATFPPELPKRCILAGSKEGDVILDPFAGTGTTGAVALELGRSCILIEAKAEYVGMIRDRLSWITPSMFSEGADGA